MTDVSRWPAADRILDDALALPPEQREAFVRLAAGDDAPLREALCAVVREAATDDGFLAVDRAVASAVAGALETETSADTDTHDLLAAGAMVEHYEVTGIIGRGGMGEVYRARDRRLGRDVAIKVLPRRFVADADRLARLKREAQVLASLSHPGIGAIYDLADVDGQEALVLEYVAGPTLAERIAAGPLPIGEVVAIARQLVDALDAAHQRGVLHRDLKPANVKVTSDGAVKILDFGLAKPLEVDGDSVDLSTDLTGHSPQALLGTAAYMSPEQIRRAPLDPRTDIWSFGCVLFEMLAGTRAFPGAWLQGVLSLVLEREPAYGLLPSDTPDALRRLLRRTLEKDPQRRLGYIGDARLDLEEAAQAPLDEHAAAPPASRSRAWAWAAAGLLLGVVGTAAVLSTRSPAPSPARSTRFVLPLGDLAPVLSYQPMLAMTPDGRAVAFRARRGGESRVYIRRLDALDASPVPGTDGATGLFFSPDAQWIGFDRAGELQRAAVAGGPPLAITAAPGGATSTWAPDDSVIFATNTGRVLQRVSATGGSSTPLTSLDAARGDTLHLLPQVLPGGRRVLFTVVAGQSRYVATTTLDSAETTIVTEGAHGRFLPPNTLLFLRQGVILAQRFEPARGRLSGAAVPVLFDVAHTDHAVAHYDVSPDGTLAYLPASDAPAPRRTLVWIDRNGRLTPTPAEARAYTRLALAPNAERVAVGIEDAGNTDVWVVELSQGRATRLTTAPSIETAPAWSPDNRWIAYRSERDTPGIFRQDPDGAAPAEQITTTDGPIHSPVSWSADGATLFFALFLGATRQAIASVTPPDRSVQVLLDGEAAQYEPHLSPDGRFLAYQSNESGRLEVYVRPYPDVTAGRWQVSTKGGWSPRWTRDGRELFYLDGRGLASVNVGGAGSFDASVPRTVVDLASYGDRLATDYDPSADGQRFLFVLDEPDATGRQAAIVVTEGWSAEVERRLAEGR